MDVLPGPYEILEMSDGEVRLLHIESYDVGEMTITPRDGRGSKTIVALRLHVSPSDKGLFPFYWDVTATTLSAQLVPILQARQGSPVDVRLAKYGVAPRARFGVEVVAQSGAAV